MEGILKKRIKTDSPFHCLNSRNGMRATDNREEAIYFVD